MTENDRPNPTDDASAASSEPGGGSPGGASPGGAQAAPPTAGRGMTMADYEEAMTERAQAARARGLAAPYIAGGRDPDPERGRREERFYLRLLVAMVAAIVLGGFAISILYLLLTGGR